MKPGRVADEALRRQALGRLGPLAPPLAREALEHGLVEVEHDVLSWEGTLGTRRAHRVVVVVEPELAAALRDAPSAVDALTAAFAEAIARGEAALASLDVEARGGVRAARGTAYRGPV